MVLSRKVCSILHPVGIGQVGPNSPIQRGKRGRRIAVAQAKILVVEDDRQTTRDIQTSLEGQGFDVRVAHNGISALEQAYEFLPDLMIVDIDLSSGGGEGEKMDGLTLLESLRRESETPVLMLTGTTAPSVKVFALTMGADDYLTKPFDMRELIARIGAILRRGRPKANQRLLTFKLVTIDPAARRVWKRGAEVQLSPLEFDILFSLAKRPGWAFSRAQLIRQAWKFDRYGDERVVDTHIGILRKKLEDIPSRPTIVVTVRGVGYRFEDEPQD